MAKKGQRKVTTSEVLKAIRKNGGVINAQQLMLKMKNPITYVTAKRRLAEMADDDILEKEGYKTDKGYNVAWYRIKDKEKEKCSKSSRRSTRS